MVSLKRLTPSDALIILLIGVAATLGFLIYKQKNPSFVREELKIDNEAPVANNNSDSSQIMRPTPGNLTKEEKMALNPPGQDATVEERNKHFNTIVSLAQKTELLDINSCKKPNPLVIEVKLNEKIKIKNSDSKDHTIRVDNEHQYLIKAKETKDIIASFGKGQGAYGYLCDEMGGVVGFFLVKP